MEYIRLCKSTRDYGKLIPVDEFYSYFSEKCEASTDWYRSLFQYNEEHFQQFEELGTIRGIRDVVTTRLFFDFDCVEYPEQAQADAVDFCKKLIIMGIPTKGLQICFSGSKGFAIEIETHSRFNLQQYRNIYGSMMKDYKTADIGVTLPTQLSRIPFTKHPKTGLFKVPLTYEELTSLDIDQIKEKALTNDYDVDWWEIDLPEKIEKLKFNGPQKEEVKKSIEIDIGEIDYSKKPRWLSNCKYAILNGCFKSGKNRSHAMMALASTFKAQGFPSDITESMLNTAAAKQGKLEGVEPFSAREIKENVINQVYSSFWTGGTYSCKTTPWLKEICDSLGENKCKHHVDDGKQLVFNMPEVEKMFHHYAVNIDKNTIKLGIPSIDKKLHLTVGMPVGLLGAPSSGKTSVGLEILRSNSVQGIKSMFFSMDMYAPIVYLKQIQKLTGYQSSRIFRMIKDNDDEYKKITKQLEEEYKNVKFCFQSGLHAGEIREKISEYKEEVGDELKLVLIDYHECIGSEYSDPTARSGDVANKLKDVANEMDICLVNIVQPQKHTGDPSEALTSMRNVKGSSLLEQSFRVIIGIYREGFDIYHPEVDRFMTFNCLKNTMGSLFSVDCSWHGLTGSIGELEDIDKADLSSLRENKKEKKEKKNAW